ncbi:MAG: hypothetical protein BHK79_01145 [Halanaerobium sp. MDAL1]|nr:MAG: hypothetical protein BHK79_01145 [Halanaerobium sp. MDAL1]
MNNNGKSKLEKTAREGAFGPTELKKGEKNRFLGEFEERVIAYLSESQIKEKALYPEIKEALQSKEANKLIIRGDIDKSLISDYIEWAREAGVSFNRKNSPEFRGNVALAVAGKDAVKQQFGKIPDREEKLQKKGLSDNIIKNAGSLLCSDCWKELMEKAPEEKVNYKKAGIFDKLTGTGCTGCQKK